MKIFQCRSKLAAISAVPVLVGAVALAVGAFIQPVAATPPSGGGTAGSSGNAFAVGGLTPTDPWSGAAAGHVAFAALQPPNSGSSKGHVVQQDVSGAVASGYVYCFAYSGMNARVIWHVQQSNNMMIATNTYRQFDITDVGEPNMGMSPDMYSDRGECSYASDCGTQNNMTPCCACTAMAANNPIVNGNIVLKHP